MHEILNYLIQNMQPNEDHIKRQIQYILGQLNLGDEDPEDSSDEESDQEDDDEEAEIEGEDDEEEEELEGKVINFKFYRRRRF